MAILKNEEFKQAVESHDLPKYKLAIFADSSLETLEKVLEGNTDMQISSIDKLASYLDFDVIVNIVPRSPKTKTAAA